MRGITKVLSSSSYQLKFRGYTYRRNAAELRRYKSSKLPLELPTANDNSMYDTNLKLHKGGKKCMKKISRGVAPGAYRRFVALD